MTAGQLLQEFSGSELADLSTMVAMQPDGGQWSREKEQGLDQLVLEEETFAWARGKILGSDVQCRRSVCRASYRFAHLLDVDDFASQLVLMMDPEFEVGRTLPVRRPDGSYDVHVFVVTRDSQGLLSTGRVAPDTIPADQFPRGGVGG
ncbi:hypothetical protein [Arenimonas soli]|nr:hypothetical protein [Arenimonas soli]